MHSIQTRQKIVTASSCMKVSFNTDRSIQTIPAHCVSAGLGSHCPGVSLCSVSVQVLVQGRNYHEASEAVASSLKSRLSNPQEISVRLKK